MPRMLTLQFGLFTLLLWLGCYLLVTDVVRRRLWYAGMGLLAYALAIGWSIFLRSGVVGFNGALLLTAIAAMLWMATMITLLPEQEAAYDLLWKIWRFGLLPIMLIAGLFLLLRTDLTQLWRILFAVDVIVPLIIVAAAVMGNRSGDFSGRVHWLFAVVTALFVFSLLALPLATSRTTSIWILLSGGADLVLLALIVTAYDAWDQGERLFLDFVRSLAGAGAVALAFALPVIFTMRVSTGATVAMTGLLLNVLFLAIVIFTLFEPLQRLLDRIAFSAAPALHQERTHLRATAQAIARVDHDFDLLAESEEDFGKLTRRALSNLGNISRLAASPLTQLPAVDRRLADHPLEEGTLARAHALRDLLVESIHSLAPGAADAFLTTDERRFFNALYYPYVAGLKPYRRNAYRERLPADQRAAFDWFRTEVPERTLYNWQNQGARLIAQHLRELSTE